MVVAVWAVPALLASFETYTFWRLAGRATPAWRAVAAEAPAWFTYALLTPVIFALGRRFPLRRAGGAWASRAAVRTIAAHALAALAAGALYAAAATGATLVAGVEGSALPPTRLFVTWFVSGLPLAVLTYAGVLGAGYALAYSAESRRREAEAAHLAAQLAEARLGALRMQLHPHFLFNALNAATVLARDGDTRAVAEMLTRLAALLRAVLHDERGHEVALADEVAFVRRYLDVERVRFPDRLRVTFDVAGRALGAAVPSFVLQPLVENAVRHGIAPRSRAGRLEIGARLQGPDGAQHLELRVRDDGAGLPAGWTGAASYGVGLSNTAARLAALYGDGAALTVAPAEGGGTVAIVRIPLRPARPHGGQPDDGPGRAEARGIASAYPATSRGDARAAAAAGRATAHP